MNEATSDCRVRANGVLFRRRSLPQHALNVFRAAAKNRWKAAFWQCSINWSLAAGTHPSTVLILENRAMAMPIRHGPNHPVTSAPLPGSRGSPSRPLNGTFQSIMFEASIVEGSFRVTAAHFRAGLLLPRVTTVSGRVKRRCQ